MTEKQYPAEGVTDHGNLSGLGDDDHPQYYERYSPEEAMFYIDETGTVPWKRNDTEGSVSTGNVLTEVKEITLNKAPNPVIKVSVDLKVTAQDRENAEIRRNGTTVWSNTSLGLSYATYTTTMSAADGDVISLHVDSGYTTETIYYKNFRIVGNCVGGFAENTLV